MGVYLWNNVYEYSYDFRNKSSTILTNDGWTIYTGSSYITSDTNGLWCSTNGQNIGVQKSIGDVFSTAKRVILTYNVYVNKAGTTGDSASMRIVDASRGNTCCPYIGAESATGPQGYKTSFVGTDYGRQNVNFTQGLHSMVYEVDLVNKVLTQTISGYTTITQALTDAQLTTFKSLQYLYLRMFANANVPVYKSQGFNLTVEC